MASQSTCHEFATYSAKSGGRRNGTLKLNDLTQIVAIAWGTETDPNDTFVVEITLLNSKSYLVQYLAGPPPDQQPEPGQVEKEGNALLLELFCAPSIPEFPQ